MIRWLPLLVCLALVPVQAGAAPAKRIVTLAPHLAELVCAAGGCDRLVGVARYTDYPEQAAKVQQIGDAVAVNLEQVLALKPDLVLVWDGGTAPDTIRRLRGLGLNVEGIKVQKLSEVANALWHVGDLMQTRRAAALAVNRYYQQLDLLRNRYRNAAAVRVFYQIERSPMYTISARSPISEAIEICGGKNVFADLPQIAGAVSSESVLASDPEAVVFATQDGEAVIRAQWARWPGSRAQKLGNLYAINGDLLARQSPRLLDGVQQLCDALESARVKLGTAAPAVALDP